MKVKRFILIVAPVFVMGLGLLALPRCGGVNLGALTDGSGGGLGDVASAAANCPSLGSVSAIGKVNFQSEFGMDAHPAARLESALKASLDLTRISSKIEADLKKACGNLARDLGANPGPNAKSACKAAAKAIGRMKAKAGGKFVLKIKPPQCSASIDATAKCAADCDAQLKPGQVKVKCEGGQLSGKCDAMCKGKCEMQAGAQCKGTCEGHCSANFSGSCSGKCKGKCDGKDTGGPADCSGTCIGTCGAGGSGKCGGTCKGECKIQGQASCSGTCTGGCSVEMKAPKCTGQVKPPQMSAECEAECDAKVKTQLSCTPAAITAKFVGAADAAAATRLVKALKANLPAILKVSIGMKGHLKKVAGNVKTVVKGVRGSLEGMAKGSASNAARLTACVLDPLKAALDASGRISANVSVSVEVQASASASASTK